MKRIAFFALTLSLLVSCGTRREYKDALLRAETAMDEHPEEILRAVDKAVADFVGEAEQFDDLTMLCIEYRGRAEEAKDL